MYITKNKTTRDSLVRNRNYTKVYLLLDRSRESLRPRFPDSDGSRNDRGRRSLLGTRFRADLSSSVPFDKETVKCVALSVYRLPKLNETGSGIIPGLRGDVHSS